MLRLDISVGKELLKCCFCWFPSGDNGVDAFEDSLETNVEFEGDEFLPLADIDEFDEDDDLESE